MVGASESWQEETTACEEKYLFQGQGHPHGGEVCPFAACLAWFQPVGP